MESKIYQEEFMQELELDSEHKERLEYLEQMLDGNETDLKDEEPDCYVLGYN